MMKKWKRNIIMISSLSVIMVGLGVTFFYLWVSPIKDATLRADILHTLHLEAYMDDKRRPTKEDLQQLTTLTSSRDEDDEQKVETLKGLQYATNLEELAIHRGKFTDLTPLQSLGRGKEPYFFIPVAKIRKSLYATC